MTTRSPLFRTFRKPEKPDPLPHVLTDAERAHVLDRLSAGQCPRLGVIRKMLRLCDERLDILCHLARRETPTGGC